SLRRRRVFAPDDRTGNVLTTVALFAAGAAVAYAARDTLVLVILSLLVAYLVEPSVAWVEARLPARAAGRTNAIAVVYSVGALLIAGAAYAAFPAIARQMRQLASAPDMLRRAADLSFIAQHKDTIAGAAERAVAAVVGAVERAGFLALAPIVAVFFLVNRSALIERTVDLFAGQRDRARVQRTVERVDTMLAGYIPARLPVAGLSAAFY